MPRTSLAVRHLTPGLFAASVVATSLVATGCGSSGSSRAGTSVAASASATGTSPATTPTSPTTSPATSATTPSMPPATRGFAPTKSFAYQLQSADLSALIASEFDLFVIDYSKDGSEAERWVPSEVQALRASKGGRPVLAYMSIGEAEDYRFYWQKSWKPGSPSWLGPTNPQWAGNYKVRYWDKAWQSIVFGSATSYLDKILDAGFDGVYLDVIDAFEFWGPGGSSGENRASAARDMVELVKAIADYARNVRGRKDFKVVPQNGDALGAFADYLDAVDGIGTEDVWYDGNKAQPAAETNARLANLDLFTGAGKLVLVIDYVTTKPLIDAFYAKAQAKGYVPYATVRALDRLTVNAGHEPKR